MVKFLLAAAMAALIGAQAHAEMPIDQTFSDQGYGANTAASFNAYNQTRFDNAAAAEEQRERDDAMQRRMDDIQAQPPSPYAYPWGPSER